MKHMKTKTMVMTVTITTIVDGFYRDHADMNNFLIYRTLYDLIQMLRIMTMMNVVSAVIIMSMIIKVNMVAGDKY